MAGDKLFGFVPGGTADTTSKEGDTSWLEIRAVEAFKRWKDGKGLNSLNATDCQYLNEFVRLHGGVAAAARRLGVSPSDYRIAAALQDEGPAAI